LYSSYSDTSLRLRIQKQHNRGFESTYSLEKVETYSENVEKLKGTIKEVYTKDGITE